MFHLHIPWLQATLQYQLFPTAMAHTASQHLQGLALENLKSMHLMLVWPLNGCPSLHFSLVQVRTREVKWPLLRNPTFQVSGFSSTSRHQSYLPDSSCYLAIRTSSTEPRSSIWQVHQTVVCPGVQTFWEQQPIHHGLSMLPRPMTLPLSQSPPPPKNKHSMPIAS